MKSFVMAVLLTGGVALAGWPAYSQEPPPNPGDEQGQHPGTTQEQHPYGHHDKDKQDVSLEAKRTKIDASAQQAIDRLLNESSNARALYDQAYGYAVFTDSKVTIGISGSGGVGEAVEKATGRKVYMKMAGAGAALGLGAQKYQVVFLFQNKETFDRFVDKGWKAEGNAGAVIGDKGANAQTDFTNGLATFTLNEKGLALQADLSGTKYFKSDKLNAGID